MPPITFAASGEVIGSLTAWTVGRTASATDAPGQDAGTAKCPTWAPLPNPAATWLPALPIAPSAPPSPGTFGRAAAAAAAG